MNSQYTLTLDKKIEMVRMSVRAVTRGYKISRLVTGNPGIGKSFAVLEEIKNEIEFLRGEGKNLSYELVSGGIKDAVSFYTTLADNNNPDKIILLDDVNVIITDKECREILRAATTNEVVRRVSYAANKIVKGKSFYRPKMDFTSKIIIITNIQRSKIDKGILSRTSPIEILATSKEIFNWVGMNLEEAPPHDMPLKWKEKVYNFIKDEIVEKNQLKHFDFRVFEDCCMWLGSCVQKKIVDDKEKITFKEDWKSYVYSMCV